MKENEYWQCLLPPTDLTADILPTYFDDKVNIIRRNFESLPKPVIAKVSMSSLEMFISYDVEEIQRLIIASPSKSCQLDPVPSNIVKEFITELLPFIARMCNSSLETSYIPQSQRHAVIHLF